MLSQHAVFAIAIRVDRQGLRNRCHCRESQWLEFSLQTPDWQCPNFSSPAHRYDEGLSGFVETLGYLAVQAANERPQFASQPVVWTSAQKSLDQRHDGRLEP